jgi:hypothetical protein
VERIAKYRSSRLKEDQFIARNACQSTGSPGINFFSILFIVTGLFRILLLDQGYVLSLGRCILAGQELPFTRLVVPEKSDKRICFRLHDSERRVLSLTKREKGRWNFCETWFREELRSSKTTGGWSIA